MKQGNIGVTTENIFPVIKKFLYSDHEIFIREIVSNAVDATQKLKTLAGKGDFKGELGDLKVTVSFDKEAKTITVSDRGIGMTADEIEKYINQIAFSGANDFLDKYKDDANAIIGHFGLGFYSSFMVSKQVDIITKSYQDAPAVKWTCDGSPSYTIEEVEKADRGTDIVMHIDDDCEEFLDKNKLEGLLRKYCHFLPVPIAFGKKTEWKDGKQVDTDEDNIINDVEPLWTKKPADLKDEDYKEFYRHLFPMADEPLFWIHLNVDYPFNLTGILYFPKIKNNIELQRNKIQLYCNQVFVTDAVEGIVPEFLTLLHGVIDSPDIPLNVSRSYLQSDQNVKKISGYITKKVSDRLAGIFKNERSDFEKKWDDIKIFIHYGMLTEEDFYEKAKAFFLFKDTSIVSMIALALDGLILIAGFVVTYLNIPVEKQANALALQMLREYGLATEDEIPVIEKVYEAYILQYIADFILEILRMIQWILEIRRHKSVIYNQKQPVTFCNFCNSRNVCYIHHRVGWSFDINGFCI